MAMANSDDRFDYALDQTSKKLSVTLRKEQRDAVKSIAAGNDTFVSLPTGGGKSSLPFLFDSLRNVQGSIVIVKSPLLALMKNHVEILTPISMRWKNYNLRTAGNYIPLAQNLLNQTHNLLNGLVPRLIYTHNWQNAPRTNSIGKLSWFNVLTRPLLMQVTNDSKFSQLHKCCRHQYLCMLFLEESIGGRNMLLLKWMGAHFYRTKDIQNMCCLSLYPTKVCKLYYKSLVINYARLIEITHRRHVQ